MHNAYSYLGQRLVGSLLLLFDDEHLIRFVFMSGYKLGIFLARESCVHFDSTYIKKLTKMHPTVAL